MARSLRDRFKLGSDSAGLPADLVAMPAMDEGRVTTGSARVMPFAQSGGPVDISSFGGPARTIGGAGDLDEDCPASPTR